MTKALKSRPAARKVSTLLNRHRQQQRRRPQIEREFDLLALAAREPAIAEPLWPSGDIAFLSAVLRAQLVPEILVQRVVSEIPAAAPGITTLTDRLTEALTISFAYTRLEDILRPGALLLAGPPGAGKTTLAGKLAARFNAESVRLIVADTGRPGGIAQLTEYATALGIPLAAADTPDALRALLAERSGTTSIIDTGGVNPADEQAWESLRPWIAASDARPLLVLPANTQIEDTMGAARAFRALGGQHFMVTRFDMVRRIGSALSATLEGLTLSGVSVTPHFAYGLRALTPLVLAHRLMAGALDEQHWHAPAA